MLKGLKPILALLLMAAVFGCASKKEELPSRYQALDIKNQNAADEKREREAAKQVVATAHKAIGTPYVRGGSKPGGFDCSGFVMWAYDRVGVKLPRTAREQSTVGEKIRNPEEMRAGDIVAFRHPKRGYHTGIYVGDGKFIHSPRKRSRVKISSLDDAYFRSTLLGARRVKFDCSDTLLVQAGSQLENYMFERENDPAPVVSKSKKSVKNKSSKTSRRSFQQSRKSGKAVASAKKSKKISKSASVKAVASKKSAKSSVSRKSSSKKLTAQKSVKKTAAKKSVKTIVQNSKRLKSSSTAKVSAKKASSKSVSMLRKKSR